jgi:hypothetical protein
VKVVSVNSIILGWKCVSRYVCSIIVLIDEHQMPVDLHYICKRGENYKYLGEDMFETGNWTATNSLSSLGRGLITAQP